MKPTLEHLTTWAAEAGEIIRAGYGKAHDISYKGRIDLVTETDHTSEDLLIGHIRQEFPEHSIITEESGKLGLVSYSDNPERSELVQFRLRRAGRWKNYDLRALLSRFSITNGGGHEGAIGFRIPRTEIPDFHAYVDTLVSRIEAAIAE